MTTSLQSTDMTQRLLFVSGCPRSGTTVVTTILNWSDELLIAQERFAPLLRHHPDSFTPDLYQIPRFLDFRPGDCGYGSFASKREYHSPCANPKNFEDIGGYRVVGDKITHLFRRFDMFRDAQWCKRDITIVHVIRNIRDVAASYESRRQDATDDWTDGAREAVAHWSESMQRVLELIERPIDNVRLLLVDYDTLFAAGEQALLAGSRKLFDLLGVEMGAKQVEGLARVGLAARTITARRGGRVETAEALLARVSEVDLNNYRQLAALSLWQRNHGKSEV